MADRIKGITVVIGGDAGPLAKALTDVNKVISKTQSALKDIDKVLKSDPQNAVLLAEKQKLLNQQYLDSQIRLKELNAAYTELNRQYREGKISEDQYKQGLLDLKIAIGQAQVAVKDYGTQLLQLQAQMSPLYQAGQGLQAAGNAMSKAGRALRPASLAAAAAVTAAVKTSGSYDEAMSQVQATMGILSDEMYEFNGEMVSGAEVMNALARATQDQAEATKYTATDSATALNVLALAGYSAEKQIKTLPSVLTLAAAGNMELEEASQAAISTMNVLGISADSLDSELDKMAKTASSSNTDLSQLNEAIKVVGGFANMAQLPTEKLYAAIGILADNGVKASKGGTMLRTVIKNLYTPTTAQAKAMASLGFETADAQGNLREFDDILSDLAGHLNAMDEATRIKTLKSLFDTRGVAGAYALLRSTGLELTNIYGLVDDLGIEWEKYGLAEDGAAEIAEAIEGIGSAAMKTKKIMDDYGMSEEDAADIVAILSSNTNEAAGRFDELTEKIVDSGGAAKRMQETQVNNLNGALKMLRASAENAGIAFGHSLTPALRDLAGHIKNLAQWYTQLDPKQQALIAKLTVTTAAAAPLLAAVGKLTSGIGALGMGIAKTVVDFTHMDMIAAGNAEAISGLGKAVVALGGSGGLAVLGVGMAAAVAATQAFENSIRAAYEEAERARFDLDGLVESVDRVTGEYTTFTEAKQGVIDAAGKEAYATQLLWTELQRLADEDGRVHETDQARAEFILGQLNQALGTEYTLQDGLIQQYGQMKASVDALIEAKKMEAVLAGMQETYTTALTNRKDAENAVKEAAEGVVYTEEKLSKAQKDAEQARTEYNAALRNGTDDIGAYRVALDQATEKEAAAQAAYDTTKQKLDEATAAYEGYEQTIQQYEGLASAAVSGDAQAIQDALLLMENDFKHAKDSSVETLQQQVDEWSRKYIELKNEVDRGSKTITETQVNEAKRMRTLALEELNKKNDEFKKSLNTELTHVRSDAPLITKAMDTETQLMVKNHKTEVDKLQPNMDLAIKQTSSYLNTTAKDQMEKDGTLIGTSLADKTKTSVEGKQSELQTSIDTTMKNATSPTITNMQTWGRHMGDNMASGIRDSIPAIRAAAEDAAEAAAGPLEHSVPKEGPLKDELEWMPHMMQNLAKGIRDNSYLVSREMMNLAQEMAAAGNPSQRAVNLYVRSDLNLDKRRIAQAVNEELGLMI